MPSSKALSMVFAACGTAALGAGGPTAFAPASPGFSAPHGAVSAAHTASAHRDPVATTTATATLPSA
eukprot:CAMPEP_0203919908 /NCGR_PEP_ID=MMETSP0359-20131031/60268_1 /ASSEMBLY_ACC=CAM_ASM_000338 /TAXON_ID=268821 /ORGANISM="Scrippsiella Hangoei, Strain SHTV-5" /LENGTH=66 /DNA_ID=CAMNT_0050847301 /DNA_START=17 /DNA_END=213 /DNA_ORIENTATION=-